MSTLRTLLPLALISLASTGVFAQSQRSGGPGAAAQALQQMQQLAAERTALQGENSRLKGELEKLRKERDSLKAAQEAVAQRGRGAEAALARANIDKARLEGDVAQQKERVTELVSRFRETATGLREVETERETLRRANASLEQDLGQCRQYNGKLVALNRDVLARLEGQGALTAIARREPFTQIKRVQLQNLADEYRGLAEDATLQAPPAAPVPAAGR